MDRDDTILNSKDVACILDLSPDTVNEYRPKSILPAFQEGAAVAVSQARYRRFQAPAARRNRRLRERPPPHTIRRLGGKRRKHGEP